MANVTNLDFIARAFGELCHQPRWLEWRNEGDDKVPYVAGTTRKASHSNPQHWRRFDQCRGEQRGLVFNGDGLGGIDLDGCRNPDSGEVADWAREALVEFDSYVEVSPSGTGVKIFARGAPASLPAHV